MRIRTVALVLVVTAGCTAPPSSDATEPMVAKDSTAASTVTTPSTLSPTTTTSTAQETSPASATPDVLEPTSRPPKVETGSARGPTHLPILGLDVWLVEDWDEPDFVVRTNDSGTIVDTLWKEDLGSVGASSSGHTLLCYDADDDGTVDLVDLRFRFAGNLGDTYQESRTVNGTVISETEVAVDGANVPDEIFRTCGAPALGPHFRVTAMQWGAALNRAGFTDIGGDHAIDPVWEAVATWNGVEYFPLNLFQGEFRPDLTDDTVLVECELGAVQLPSNLPADARSAIESVAEC